MPEQFSEILSWIEIQWNQYLKGLTLPVVFLSSLKLLKVIYHKYQDYKNEKDLFPYYTKKSLRESQHRYIRTKCQNIDPANELNYKSSFAFATKEDLLRFFLKKVFKVEEPDNRFYLILGDSGMGKTTFILNLYIRYKSIFNPTLLKKKLQLFPLGENFEKTLDNIKSVKNPRQTILLLDGFDEMPEIDKDDIHVKFNQIINYSQDFSTVIITCRTHFFSSESDEPYELKIKKFNTEGNGYHILKKLYISPLDQEDVNNYIRKTFHLLEFNKKKKALQIVRNTKDLMVRPMLLSYIKEIVETKTTELQTNFDLYEALIMNWIKREANKYPIEERRNFELNLAYFSFGVADYIYQNYSLNGIYIPLVEVAKLSEVFKINLTEIEIKSRSLLNRNSNGDYKFSHKSIFEFFLAYSAYNQRRLLFSDPNTFKIKYDLETYDVAKGFIEDIIISRRHKFYLPRMSVVDKSLNNDLYKRILDAKNENSVVAWTSGSTLSIIKDE